MPDFRDGCTAVADSLLFHAEKDRGLSIKYVRNIFKKTNIPNPLIRTCAYQGVRNISFSGNFAYVLNG